MSVEDAILTAWKAAVIRCTSIAIDEQERSSDEDASTAVLNAQRRIIDRIISQYKLVPDDLVAIKNTIADLTGSTS